MKILLVDDEELVRLGLARALGRKDGVEIRAVGSGEEAIRELCSRPYHLCILDYHLTDMDGCRVLTAIQDKCPHTRVALMTASVFDSDHYEQLNRQAHYFLPKPFDLDQIRAVVDEVAALT